MPDEQSPLAIPDLSPDVVAAAMEKAKDINLSVPPKPFIAEVNRYRNHQNIMIAHNKIVSGELPKEIPEYVASSQLILGEGEQTFKQPIFAPVEAKTIEEAFEKAPEALEKAGREWLEAMEAKAKARIASQALRTRLTAGFHPPPGAR